MIPSSRLSILSLGASGTALTDCTAMSGRTSARKQRSAPATAAKPPVNPPATGRKAKPASAPSASETLAAAAAASAAKPLVGKQRPASSGAQSQRESHGDTATGLQRGARTTRSRGAEPATATAVREAPAVEGVAEGIREDAAEGFGGNFSEAAGAAEPGSPTGGDDTAAQATGSTECSPQKAPPAAAAAATPVTVRRGAKRAAAPSAVKASALKATPARATRGRGMVPAAAAEPAAHTASAAVVPSPTDGGSQAVTADRSPEAPSPVALIQSQAQVAVSPAQQPIDQHAEAVPAGKVSVDERPSPAAVPAAATAAASAVAPTAAAAPVSSGGDGTSDDEDDALLEALAAHIFRAAAGAAAPAPAEAPAAGPSAATQRSIMDAEAPEQLDDTDIGMHQSACPEI